MPSVVPAYGKYDDTTKFSQNLKSLKEKKNGATIMFPEGLEDTPFNWSAILERNVEGQNFVVQAYARTLVLRKELRWLGLRKVCK